jgi:serine protease AprX
MKRLFLCFGIVVGLTATLPAEAQHRHRASMDKTVRESMAKGGSKRQRVIVRYRKAVEQAVESKLNARGHRVKRKHRRASALTAEVTANDLSALSSDPDIDGISADAVVTGHALPLYLLPQLGANVMRKTLGLSSFAYSGAGVGIAVIDSGIGNVKDLEGRLVASYDFTGDSVLAVLPNDKYGHGTHIAGLIAGSGLQGGGKYAGIAPDVRLISLKVLDDKGAGYTSDVLEAIDYAVEHRARLGIHVINLSLGHPILEPAATDPLVQAVERATKAGIVVVAAAGNLGRDRATDVVAYGGITSPGNAPSAITVGGTATQDSADRDDDAIGRYSSRGPSVLDNFVKPDLVAPGDGMIATTSSSSSLFMNYPGSRRDNVYLRLSGTSMASGVVSGAVALVLEANRKAMQQNGYYGHARLTPNAVKAILQYTAIVMKDASGVTLDTLSQGAGSLNVKGAIALAAAIDPSVPVGSPWLTRGVVPVTSIAGEYREWSKRVLWGRKLLMGDLFLYNAFAWGRISASDDHVVWGSDDHVVWSSDDHVVWSSDDHVVWGSDDHVVWGSDDHVVWGSDDHVVWGSDDHVVWGSDDHVVWGSDDHVVWGSDDHVVWGSSAHRNE